MRSPFDRGGGPGSGLTVRFRRAGSDGRRLNLSIAARAPRDRTDAAAARPFADTRDAGTGRPNRRRPNP
ncbi:hypothetical protein [Methylobacterium sp. J-090]|uniref:hypothetical protein n=1 Tax=Methylobacterium sp. J-090 TaxID=2836666 RepID=UPI001FB9A90C|nr:hypothetical protein [Methylobacterium sp. J-090]MCJ2081045.1 hypothetical protein [Methylobacterium sp. J-090]